jgi:hypothetical protein
MDDVSSSLLDGDANRGDGTERREARDGLLSDGGAKADAVGRRRVRTAESFTMVDVDERRKRSGDEDLGSSPVHPGLPLLNSSLSSNSTESRY